MATPEDVIRRYVDATSAADGDAAAALTADDAVIELPDGGVLKGKEAHASLPPSMLRSTAESSRLR
jgi:ketosteroid isomerase-like protein